MAHVFISYSRRDVDFVRRLQDGLRTREREVWVDLEGIPPTAEWLGEIHAAIEAADAVAFVLSPDFASSEVCGLELAHAVETNKRLIPLLRSDTPAEAVPRVLRDLNWILFREKDHFDAAVDRLIDALDTDLDQVRAHTRYLTRALEWERRQSDKSVLLRGRDLGEAEAWLAASEARAPKPTELHRRFITASRGAARARRRITTAALGTGAVAAAVLSVVAINARQSADLAERRAAESQDSVIAARALARAESVRAEGRRREALAAHARSLAEQSRSEAGDLRILLALAALRITEPESPLTVARQALIDALYSQRAIPSFEPRRRVTRGRTVSAGTSVSALSFGEPGSEGLWLYGHARLAGVRAWEVCITPDAVCGATDAFGVPVEGLTDDVTDGSAVAASGGSGFAATGSRDDRARVWRLGHDTAASSSRLLKTIALSDNNATVLSVSADGRRLLTRKYRARTADLWDLSVDEPTSTRVAPPGAPSEITAAAFSPDGRWLAVAAGVTVYLWDLGDLGLPRYEFANGRQADALAFSPDGRWLAAGPRLWKLSRLDSDSIEPPRELRGHSQAIRALVFSPDNRWLVSAGNSDGSPNGGISTRVWDLSASDPTASPIILPHRDPTGSQLSITVQSAAFSRGDQAWLATAISNPGIVLLWPLRAADLAALACQAAGRDITEDEWGRHVRDVPYRPFCAEQPISPIR